MRASKILVIALPLALVGCNEFFGNNSETFYTPPPAAPVASPKSTSTGHQDCGCPVAMPDSIPSSALPQSAAASEADAAWFPSEGHLVYAGDLVMELKASKHGVYPSHAEMAQYLQANMKRFPGMGVNAAQAEKVLEELGL